LNSSFSKFVWGLAGRSCGLLGIRGLLDQADSAGDKAEALRLAEKANRLQPKAQGAAQRFSEAGARVIINDRVDVAIIAGASGVHLPEQGLPTEGARRLLGPASWIGRSVHSAEAARAAAADGADYVMLGPIWETASHPGRLGIGLEAIAEANPARVIAIGGVTPERIAPCLSAGAYGVAAVSALWNGPDLRSAAQAMLLSLSEK